MKFKLIAAPLLCLMVAGCDLKGNVYPMAPQQAYDKLVSTPIEPSGKGPFGRLETSVSGDGSSTVTWESNGTFAAVKCEANIVPEGTDKSRINAYCGGGSMSDGAASGMAQGLMRKALIEHIDSTLRGRAYNPELAYGATAGLWPDDPRQADGSYATAATEALKMDRDMHKAIAEAEKASEEDDREREARLANGNVNFKPGQPMVNPNSH
jgi:hypothetical protein